jgi:hypothetical protein
MLQVSPLGEQLTQGTPFFPQLFTEGVVQVFPEQQPVAQDFAVHLQVPPTHSCPGAHIGPVPHAQTPAPLQLLALTGSQGTQADPFAPQFVNEGDTHWLLAQHPVGQSHTQPLGEQI